MSAHIDIGLLLTILAGVDFFLYFPYFKIIIISHGNKIIGKVVLSVGAALCKSFFCPRLVLGLSSFVIFVFLLSLQ